MTGAVPVRCGHPIGEKGAPVMADQVDRAAERVEFADDPCDVFILGSAEAGRARAAEARQGEGDRLGIDA